MKKNTKNILIGTGITAVGLSVLATASYKVADMLVSIALDREVPKTSGKSKRRITGSDMSCSISALLEEKGKRLLQGGLKRIEIKAHDGEKLVGHLYTKKGAKRLIIAMHGWRSSWSRDFGMISEFWEENDCNILYAEQRGQNDSGGNYMGFGMVERHDCHDWVNWAISSMEEKLPIYLAGISMGATTVLMASGTAFPENVCGIMADCGFTSADDIWRHIAKNNLKISYGLMKRLAEGMCRKRINIGLREYSTICAMEKNTLPVLFIHGKTDKFVPVEMTYENYNACRAPKSLLIVDGAGHAMSYMTDKETYENKVLDFWKKIEAI
ncbi:MAG: alpha/beta hydrolase [Ruminococcaceae bacterium]|nr:alpha/beta hydrolase [Oscillospiraceae bacterium]